MEAARQRQNSRPNQNPSRRRISEQEHGRRVAERAARLQKEQKKRLEAQRNQELKQRKVAVQTFLRRSAAVFFVFACFALMAISVAGYAVVNSARVELNQMQDDLKSLEAELVDLNLLATEAVDLTEAEKIAAEEYQMSLPKEYQVVRITSPDQTVTASTEED